MVLQVLGGGFPRRWVQHPSHLLGKHKNKTNFLLKLVLNYVNSTWKPLFSTTGLFISMQRQLDKAFLVKCVTKMEFFTFIALLQPTSPFIRTITVSAHFVNISLFNFTNSHINCYKQVLLITFNYKVYKWMRSKAKKKKTKWNKNNMPNM